MTRVFPVLLAIAGILSSHALAEPFIISPGTGAGVINTPEGDYRFNSVEINGTTNTVIQTPRRSFVCNTTRLGGSSITSCY
jgi:hypothetical protein